MGSEARRRAEDYIAWLAERALAGKPVCTCIPDWFSRHIRVWAKMSTQEELTRHGLSHMRECKMFPMWVDDEEAPHD